MRLPFVSRKEHDGPEASRRSSISEDREQSVVADNASERSAVTSVTPTFTPSTSYSSTNTAPTSTDREAKKTGMYKLSVVDTSGTFLPPSPPDSGRANGVKAWGLHRKQNKPRERMASADEPFIISRESFEGYRRSFDIGGTSPTLAASPMFANSPRLSLDSSMSTCAPSISSRASRLRVSSIPKVDEGHAPEAPFEDVKLEEDDRATRKTILSRFGFGTRTVPKKREGEELQSIKMDK